MIILSEKVVSFLRIRFTRWILTLFLGIAVAQLSMIMHTLAMLGECPVVEFFPLSAGYINILNNYYVPGIVGSIHVTVSFGSCNSSEYLYRFHRLGNSGGNEEQ